MKVSFRNIGLVFLLMFISVLSVDVVAQCPMCSMAVETNLADGGSAGRGLNTGIFYILIAPYVLLISLGVIWWRRNGRVKLHEDRNHGLDSGD